MYIRRQNDTAAQDNDKFFTGVIIPNWTLEWSAPNNPRITINIEAATERTPGTDMSSYPTRPSKVFTPDHISHTFTHDNGTAYQAKLVSYVLNWNDNAHIEEYAGTADREAVYGPRAIRHRVKIIPKEKATYDDAVADPITDGHVDFSFILTRETNKDSITISAEKLTWSNFMQQFSNYYIEEDHELMTQPDETGDQTTMTVIDQVGTAFYEGS